jgi:hypothetical protein
MKTYIAPYKLGSESAKNLADSLSILRISGDKRLPRCIVINWGRSDLTLRGNVKYIFNRPDAVVLAVNNLYTLKRLAERGVSTVDWTTSLDVASRWINEDSIVYTRSTVTGQQGRGIVIAGMDSGLIDAPLYTRGYNKSHEYRVHVAFNKVIDFSKKKKRSDTLVNSFIKNSSNGWVYCREGVTLPTKVHLECVKAIAALGLDFGAVDVLYKANEDKAKILEVNTSPGIQGTTLVKYTEAFKQQINLLERYVFIWD